MEIKIDNQMDVMDPLKIPYEGFVYLPHQEEGVRWLQERELKNASHFRGGILADDMGLGKTWQLIGLLLNGTIRKTLLVVPASLIQTWIEALIKADISVHVKQDTKKNGWKKEYTSTKRSDHVYIISYDRFVSSCKKGFLHDKNPWGRVVCDEAQNMRNGTGTKRYECLMKLPETVTRWLLTGTPFQNDISDLVNLFNWLGDGEMADSLSVLVHDCLLRRTYQYLRDTDFPGVPSPYLRDTIKCETVSDEEKKLLDRLLGNIEWAKKTKTAPFILLEMFLRVNQAMAHPKVYNNSMKAKKGVYFKWRDWEGRKSGKTVALENLVISSPIEPTIVFCTFAEEIQLVAELLTDLGYTNTYVLDGGVSFGERQKNIDEGRTEVERGNNNVAYVVQWVAGGAGLNLQFCSRVVLYTQHWNPAVIQQAIGRAHRIGQKSQVKVHSLCFTFEADLNMDMRMVMKQEEKKEVAHGILATLLEEDTFETVHQ
jgi:SNF2 family DNA or RNA helicase